MKNFSLFLMLMLLCFYVSCDKELTQKVIEAKTSNASLKIDGKLYSNNWVITPEISPDIFPIEIEKNRSSRVTFITDIDSVSYQLKQGDIKNFIVLLNEKDSAFTRLEGVPLKANFTYDYIKRNKGKWSVEVIEVQELFQVISVITPTGLADTRSMIINHDSTAYYRSVLKHFLPYKNEPVVKSIDSLLQKNWYINLKADACALEFNDQNKLIKSKIYDRMRGSKNLLDPYMDQLYDFAEKSKFREFFKNNTAFYNSLIEWHEKAVPTKDQWNWLESQFPDHKYDHYRITFSPLVKGNHSTVRFTNNEFKQAVMFIRPPYRIKSVNEKISNGLITRMVFTEIDHNYVNPETDKYLKEVNDIFSDRIKWTAEKESKGYRTPYTIFNEYMTWSVYLLYCYDKFSKEDFEVINDRIKNYIVNKRGFQRFDDFHDTMLDLYKKRYPNQTVADLYPSILNWAEQYNPE
jgi:hypothetical protein